MKVIRDSEKNIIASKVKVANTMMSRFLGLMFIKEMQGYDGLILEPCSSVHNFFVRFATDVVFLDKQNKIVKILRNFKPWAVSGIYLNARKALEFKAGTIPENISVGQFLEVSDV